jgi:hypothetical protein
MSRVVFLPPESIMKLSLRPLAAVLVAMSGVGCYDLDIANPNTSDLSRTFSSAADVEAHVAESFRRWHQIHHIYQGPAMMLSSVAFQHTTANVCEAPYGEIPRRAIENSTDRQCIESVRAWRDLYTTLVTVRDGLKVLEERPDFQAELGVAGTQRLRAYGRFVQGLAHGSLALLFDRGAPVDERIPPSGAASDLVDYGQLMTAALAYLDDAAALSSGASWPAIPAEWMSVEVAPAELARLARSYKARLRANVARTPAERAAVNWAAVRADAEAGITEDWVMNMAADGYAVQWWSASLYYLNTPTRSLSQASYFVLGMADQSGSYQRWLERSVWNRAPVPDGNPILIVTTDTRFPRGATMAAQADAPGSMFAIQDNPARGWIRPDRGSWRWSLYRYFGGDDYGTQGGPWPAITAAEMRLLVAEAMLRTGDAAGAASRVNVSRTAHGLQPTNAAGANADCVPRLPDGRCGGLMEMLKWEKRLETFLKGAFLSSWYFDGRGWGDLYAGTFLQVPVPCSELTILGLGCYTYGGPGGESAAPGSVYNWKFEGG